MKSSSSGKDIQKLKRKIRSGIQHERDTLDETIRQDKSLQIANKFIGLSQYDESSCMLAYHPFRSEIDTRIIIRDAITRGKKIALPRVGKEGLELFYIKNLEEDLEPGTYGIMEPIPSRCEKAEPSHVDLAIVPGVGFDRKHNRLGYGGGFYDRLLTCIPVGVPKIALAFDLQVIDKVPVSEHDLKIDILITESQIF
jgi:5-formyltetrahydrofolate cyclo-ligase